MLDLRYLREHIDELKQNVERRGLQVDLDRWVKLDARRSELIPQVDELRAALKLSGKPTPEELADLQKAKAELAKKQEELQYIEKEWTALWGDVPNLIAPHTPEGGEEANREERQGGTKPTELEHKPG